MNFENILFPESQNLKLYKYEVGLQRWLVNAFPKCVRKYLQRLLASLQYGIFSSLNIGMNNVLWGLTFYMTIYMMTMIKYANQSLAKSQQSNIQKIVQLIKFSKHFSISFSKRSLYLPLVNLFCVKWFAKARFYQFDYYYLKSPEKQKTNTIYPYTVVLITMLLLLASFTILPKIISSF